MHLLDRVSGGLSLVELLGRVAPLESEVLPSEHSHRLHIVVGSDAEGDAVDGLDAGKHCGVGLGDDPIRQRLEPTFNAYMTYRAAL